MAMSSQFKQSVCWYGMEVYNVSIKAMVVIYC
jgi:hypothetical protein